jgi:hypothetical protein
MGKKKNNNLDEGYQPLQRGYRPQAAPEDVKPPSGSTAVYTPVNQSPPDTPSSGSEESND